MSNGQWGVGNAKDIKAFDITWVGEGPDADLVELIFGEHPHSRQDNSIYARYSDERIEGFAGHRLLHVVELREYNYLKVSGLSGNQVRRGGQGKIYINGHLCEEFFFREIEYALQQVKSKLDKIHDHPIQMWNPDDRKKLVGRKIYWRDEPAIITNFIADQACVIIEPDGIQQFRLTAADQEEIKEGEYHGSDSKLIKETIYSPHIWWWRK